MRFLKEHGDLSRRRIVSGRGRILVAAWLMLIQLWTLGACFAQPATDAKSGFLLDVPSPLTSQDVDRLLGRLNQWAAASKRGDAADGGRTTVVLRMGTTGQDSSAAAVASSNEDDNTSRSDQERKSSQPTALEDALKIARAVSGSDLKRIRLVVWVDGEVTGHDVLLPLAAETLLVSRGGSLGDATRYETNPDETIGVLYQSIARRRGLVPEPLVLGLADPQLEVSRVELLEQPATFMSGETLDQARNEGNLVSESTWSEAGEPLVLDSERLRRVRAAAAIVGSENAVMDWLELSRLQKDEAQSTGALVGRLVRITGNVTRARVRRWQSNLAASVESPDVNAWLVAIDSPGGSLSRSASLAATLADPGPEIRVVGGLVTGEARGDAALLALACRPLLLMPDAKLGGSGADVMSPNDVRRESELIELIADASGRSAALIEGLLDSSVSVHRYVNRRSGRVRYATSEQIQSEADEATADDWQRMEKIELANGLTATQAIELGLAEGTVDSLPEAATSIGLSGVPPELSDRGVVRWVERLGRQSGLAFSLLVIGFMMLSIEASAPGLGVPGFVAMVCFACFFWIKYLAGTAEWLELLAFGLGLACIGIEIFVLPGFGVFGIGGLLLTALGVLLMSQTFVVPQNAYQVGELTRGLWVTLGGLGGCVIGMFLVRLYLPQAAVATGLSMGVPEAQISETERLAHYDDLMGQEGVATTPLRPSGKGQFGETIVAVVSDGSAIERGQPIRVIQVLGNRVTVEAVD
ncbi:NfeD family protein [Rhodopirellula halodulae]|uniref:NfeD family protein n=1 Tax=Rhodopirellula halodulae TaxID=2894198 RepID=UPI001E36DE0A|nr:NfeD family protein [Rhodopirellula sp. JC737]MCC9658940.1 nodulation protein NfeD [Rhodopirellula sp. JC737]